MSRRYFTDDQVAAIAEMRRGGATLRQIIDKHGGTTTSVGNALQRAGLSKGRIPSTGLTEVQTREILERYSDGESVRALSRAFQCRTVVISDLLSQAAVEIRYGGRRHRYTASEARALAERYRGGASLALLASETGARVTTVRNTLLREGVKTRQSARPVFWTQERLTEIVTAYNSGRSQEHIAGDLGVSQRVISLALRRVGTETRGLRYRGATHPNWKGGRLLTREGYVLVVPSDGDLSYCTINSTGYAKEHRLVMGRALGRRLLRSETVHHINGDKADNRIENLQLRQGGHGVGIVFRCQACGSHDVTPVPLAG